MKPRTLVAIALASAFILGFGAGHWRAQPARAVRGTEDPAHTSSRPSGERPASAATPTRSPLEASARAAAIEFATASQNWLYLKDEDVERSVREIATPAAGPELSRETVTELRAARDALAKSPGRVWWLVRPLASHVERVDDESARVVVWTVTILSASDVALPQAEWVRVTVDLAWVDGSWRVQAIADTPGSTPMTGTKDRPWQPEPFDAALDGFERVDGEVPG